MTFSELLIQSMVNDLMEDEAIMAAFDSDASVVAERRRIKALVGAAVLSERERCLMMIDRHKTAGAAVLESAIRKGEMP